MFESFKKFDICFEMRTGKYYDLGLNLYKITPKNENDILRCHHILHGYCLYKCIDQNDGSFYWKYDDMFIKQNKYVANSPIDNYYKVKSFVKSLKKFEEIVELLEKTGHEIDFYGVEEYGEVFKLNKNIYDYIPADDGFAKGIVINNKDDKLNMIIFQNMKNEYFIIENYPF